MKQTPLHAVHVALGAKMVPFAGFEMPVSYPAGISAEHKAVRENVGVFDVSHMGEFEISGSDRNAFVQRVTCNDVGALTPGQAQYSGILTKDGTFVDDCLVYRFEDKLMMVVNASNIQKDWDTIVAQKGGANVRLRDISDETALLAVQGPKAEALVGQLTSIGVAMIPYYHFAQGKVAGVQCFISRTGYTGEDGFELYCRASDAETLWHAFVGAGRAEPVGLGARDTLRLEAGLPLYGNDIDDTTTPYEAGLAFIVKLEKGSPFTGLEALKRQKLEGVKRRLVGFKVTEPKTVARPGFAVFLDGTQVDIVRSGTVTPTVNAAIGTTYLPADRARAGTKIEIDVRGNTEDAVRPAPHQEMSAPPIRPSAHPPIRIGILTISDLGAVGQRADTSGDAIIDWASEHGYEVVVRSVVSDETDRIAGKLVRWSDSGEVDVVLTTGGTGLTERDVTPEATAAILEREAEGIAEAIRAASGPGFPRAWLSRGKAGTRGKTLIINLPGSTDGVKEGLAVLEQFLDHAVDLVSGADTRHQTPDTASHV